MKAKETARFANNSIIDTTVYNIARTANDFLVRTDRCGVRDLDTRLGVRLSNARF